MSPRPASCRPEVESMVYRDSCVFMVNGYPTMDLNREGEPVQNGCLQRSDLVRVTHGHLPTLLGEPAGRPAWRQEKPRQPASSPR